MFFSERHGRWVTMLGDHDATRMWQQLFRGQAVTSLTLTEAESLLSKLSPESPLRLRFSTELAEIRGLYQGTSP
jgi:hypothetical protein